MVDGWEDVCGADAAMVRQGRGISILIVFTATETKCIEGTLDVSVQQ